MTECHELKIIEIIAWVLAGVSVLATIPVLMNATKRRKGAGREEDAYIWVRGDRNTAHVHKDGVGDSFSNMIIYTRDIHAQAGFAK